MYLTPRQKKNIITSLMYPALARSETTAYVTPIISQVDQSTLASLTLNPYLTLTLA